MRGWRFSTPESAYSMESLMVLPFIVAQRHFIEGITLTGIKG
jgi:ABC-type glycerol-3-phosphate transport system permease component